MQRKQAPARAPVPENIVTLTHRGEPRLSQRTASQVWHRDVRHAAGYLLPVTAFFGSTWKILLTTFQSPSILSMER